MLGAFLQACCKYCNYKMSQEEQLFLVQLTAHRGIGRIMLVHQRFITWWLYCWLPANELFQRNVLYWHWVIWKFCFVEPFVVAHLHMQIVIQCCCQWMRNLCFVSQAIVKLEMVSKWFVTSYATTTDYSEEYLSSPKKWQITNLFTQRTCLLPLFAWLKWTQAASQMGVH